MRKRKLETSPEINSKTFLNNQSTKHDQVPPPKKKKRQFHETPILGLPSRDRHVYDTLSTREILKMVSER